jgi:HSP20 family protein
MANLMRRDRGAQRGADLQRGARSGAGGLFDPFDVMRTMMALDPFTDFGRGQLEGRGAQSWMVPIDVKETKDAWLFHADLPGVKQDDLDISVTGNVLTIAGKREYEQTKDEETWHAYERSYGSFTRSFTLPENANTDAISASLEQGELKLTLPKRPEMQPKKIAVSGTSTTTSGTQGKKDVPIKH